MKTPAAWVASILLLVGSAAALSVDVVETGFSIKGDEATYVSMALSVAADGDLAFDRGDLERFWSVYGRGPEGVFLKKGKRLRLALDGTFPFVHLAKSGDPQSDRLYHGKAFAYSVAAAPFVAIFGLNGLLLFNVLLLVALFSLAAIFLAARMPAGSSTIWALGFFGASVAPVYAVWLTPEIFNVALVFAAYFLWLYKEVSPRGSRRGFGWIHTARSDWLAAVLLGIATYSKPLHLLLIVPLVVVRWWRREWLKGLLVGTMWAAAVGGAFGLNAVVSGEFNYQGGERKSFYGSFPFDSPGATFENRGISYATDDVASEVVLDRRVIWSRFLHNVEYFLVGRYAGLLPYYFPAALAIALCLVRRRHMRDWQGAILLVLLGTILLTLVWLPFTWAGGGGALGNRYFIGLYPVCLFLLPPIASIWPALAGWGGTIFVGALLVQPFVTAAHPWRHVEHGLFRLLPVELTMLNDLPVLLTPGRGRMPYGEDPRLHLYLLDSNVWLDPDFMWVRGESRAELVVRSAEPLSALRFTLAAPISNAAEVRVEAQRRTVDVHAGQAVVVTMPVKGAYSRGAHAYHVKVTARRGFVPRLQDPASADGRFLGVQLQIRGVR